MEKKLTLSDQRVLGGVCGGIAEYFDLDPTIIRVAYACLTVFSAGFPGIILYLILAVVMPAKNQY